MSPRPAEFVRWVSPSEIWAAELVNDAKALTWEHEAEHLLLQLATGGLALVKGGRDGVTFSLGGGIEARSLHMMLKGREVQVGHIYWHTHPRVTGPSDGDLEALEILGQSESVIFELGGDPNGTRIRPKSGHSTP